MPGFLTNTRQTGENVWHRFVYLRVKLKTDQRRCHNLPQGTPAHLMLVTLGAMITSGMDLDL